MAPGQEEELGSKASEQVGIWGKGWGGLKSIMDSSGNDSLDKVGRQDGDDQKSKIYAQLRRRFSWYWRIKSGLGKGNLVVSVS